MSANLTIHIGRLGKDPEIRYTQTGTPICNFSIAVDDSYKKDGKKIEKTEWINIVCFGKLAEIAGEYCRKGTLVYIEGSFHTREWEDKEGNKRTTAEIRVNKLQMLGGKGEGEAEAAKRRG